MAKRKIPTEIPMEKITDPDQYGFMAFSSVKNSEFFVMPFGIPTLMWCW